MNCKVSWANALESFCRALNFEFTSIEFVQMYHIKFCVKYNCNFDNFFEDIHHF
jgi:hypothetical protein